MNKKRPTVIEDKERGISCMRLFMYTTAEQLRSIIKDRRIKVSCPWKTNDVTEGLFQAEVRQCEHMKEYGYVCFSANCTSPSMWGYYADRSTGACLVFDFPLAHIGVSDDFYVTTEGRITLDEKYLLRKVKYETKRVKRMDCSKEIDALFSKASDWSHEEEFRILVKLEDLFREEYDKDNFYSTTLFYHLKGIILGVNFPEEMAVFKRNVRLQIPHVFVVKAHFSKTQYHYEISEGLLSPVSLPKEKNLSLVDFRSVAPEKVDFDCIPFQYNKRTMKLYENATNKLYVLVKHKGSKYTLYCRDSSRWYVVCNISKSLLELLYKKAT